MAIAPQTSRQLDSRRAGESRPTVRLAVHHRGRTHGQSHHFLTCGWAILLLLHRFAGHSYQSRRASLLHKLGACAVRWKQCP